MILVFQLLFPHWLREAINVLRILRILHKRHRKDQRTVTETILNTFDTFRK